MADDDRARPRRLRREPLQAAGPAHPVCGEAPNLERDVRRDRGHGVVVPRLDPHHSRLLRRPEPDGKHGAERDRDLAEDVAGVSLPDLRLDPVLDLDGHDAALEQREERAVVAGVRGVLAGCERDIGRRARQPLPVGGIEIGEDPDPCDLVGGHHARCSQGRIGDTLLGSGGARASRNPTGRAPIVGARARSQVSRFYEPRELPSPPSQRSCLFGGMRLTRIRITTVEPKYV